jgi:neurofibromin 1
LRSATAERFPDKVYTAIGGFIFLRFFCPAISAPEGFGILEEPPTEASRRMLILITKVLQSLSNDVEFGSKEPYMTKLNDFIHSNREKLQNFYTKLLVRLLFNIYLW